MEGKRIMKKDDDSSPFYPGVCVIVLAQNAADTLPSCLSALHQFSEVIVLDWLSNDNTVEICTKFNVSHYCEDWQSSSIQLQHGISKTDARTILIIEADEIVPPELPLQIIQLSEMFSAGRYKIPRRNMVFGKQLRYGPWGKESHTRLLIRNEYGEIPDRINGELEVSLTHLHPNSFGGWWKKMLSTTTFVSTKITDFNNPPKPIRNLAKRLYGNTILDGWRGLFTVFYTCIFELMVLNKVKKLSKGRARGTD